MRIGRLLLTMVAIVMALFVVSGCHNVQNSTVGGNVSSFTPTSTVNTSVKPTNTPTTTVNPTNIPTFTPTVAPTFTPSATPTATPEPTATPTATPIPTPTPTPTPTPKPTPTPTPPSEPMPSSWWYVVTKTAKLRADSKSSAKVIVEMDNAELVQVISERQGYVKVKYGDYEGYVLRTSIQPIENKEDCPLPKLWEANCNEYITLRKYPGGYGIDTIPVGGVMELVKWHGKYAKVKYGTLTGYVLTSYIMPAADKYFDNCLDIVKVTSEYTYEQMIKDIDTFARMYSSIITVESLGTSELGRDIPVFRIGREDAEYHVLFHASIHGREHMTTWLLMAMVEYQLAHGIQDLGDVCFHIIPMVNPDGVILSQTASFTEEQLKIYNMDKLYGNTYYGKTWYASQWKANALGVDLNRNFPSGWEDIATRLEPSSEKYNGTEPLCAAESKALSEYTLRYEFDATISYHSSGCVIYYKYGDDEEMIDQCESLANAVYKVTGYVVQDGDEIDGGGYRDWAIAELGIPSITVEIGCDPAPLEYREIYSAFARNYDVLRAVAQWVKESK